MKAKKGGGGSSTPSAYARTGSPRVSAAYRSRPTPRSSALYSAAVSSSALSRSADAAAANDAYAFASESEDGRLGNITNQGRKAKPKAKKAGSKKKQPKRAAVQDPATETEGEQTDAGDIFG